MTRRSRLRTVVLSLPLLSRRFDGVSRGALMRRALLLTALLVVCGVHGPVRGQEPAQDRPTFRAEANFVRVDVYVTRDGAAVRDLRAEDFEVLEDGAPQKIATFEHVQLQEWTSQETRREPQSVAESRAIAEDSRARIVVVFLDTYHTSVEGSHRMRRPLIDFLNRAIGPDDLFAVMTPEMAAREITLTRRTATVEGILTRHWPWGMRDDLRRDPEEHMYEMCFPNDLVRTCRHPVTGEPVVTKPYLGVASEMIARRREKLVLDALADLAVYLGGVREERKAVLAVSDGWQLWGPNQNLARVGVCEEPPGVTPLGVGPDGRLTTDLRKESGYVPHADCDRDRQALSGIDNSQTFQTLLDLANRANVSFYPVDSRGLAVFDSTTAALTETSVVPQQQRLLHRIGTLRTLAGATDGMAIVDSNDLDAGMRRIADDLTSYYLLGYYSTNDELDGKFRSIKVRVKRPGVEVRARRGYKALSREELEEGRELSAAAAPDAPSSALQTALQGLAGSSRSTQIASHVSWLATPDTGRLWFTVELDPSVARSSDWAAGGVAELVVVGDDEDTVASARATVAPGARVVTLDVADVSLADGEYVSRVRLRPAGSGATLTDIVAFAVANSGSATGRPRLRRRGPTTGAEYVLTASPLFRRTERIQLEVPVSAGVNAVEAALLDRNGQPIQVPAQTSIRSDEEVTWAVAELTLAPLAAGDYAIRTTVRLDDGTHEVLTAFRIVP